ncbi:MAG: hypothetical protein N2511_00255 [Thermodesulfovibrionales bacterium]|nr:hypothetical protein [Thermodesulfovibrionales bacterium]
MKPIKRSFLSISIFSVLSIFITYSFAYSTVLFEVKSDNIPFYREDKIFTVWNPRNHPEIRTPGLKIFFFGKAEECEPEAKNGNVKVTNPNEKISKLVGLPLNERGKVFVPLQDKNLCTFKETPREGGSYVYIYEHPKEGGIGLFTASKFDEKGVSYFFQTRDERGIGGGVNKFEKVTAVTWRLEKENLFPFLNKGNLKLSITNSVIGLPSDIPNRDQPVQVRQQMEIGFANRACLNEAKEDKILCLNKFVFDFLVLRWGKRPVDLKRDAVIFIDKGQSGLPHVAIYSKSNGEIIREKNSKLDVAMSCGEGLQQNIYKEKNFCNTISWNQFQNALRAIASRHLNKHPSKITKEELKSLFGAKFDDPKEWYITVVSLQQELHDPYNDRNVFIGGNLKEIKIESKQ